jgi:hypothetical protein
LLIIYNPYLFGDEEFLFIKQKLKELLLQAVFAPTVYAGKSRVRGIPRDVCEISIMKIKKIASTKRKRHPKALTLFGTFFVVIQ